MKRLFSAGLVLTLALFPAAPDFLLKQEPKNLAPKTVAPSASKNVFLDAVINHLEEASHQLDLPPTFAKTLLKPERIVEVTFPVTMDDGSVRHFTGWRILHSTVLGPGKGGIRVKPGLTLKDVQALATEMTIKNAVGGLDLGGGKGGINADPAQLSDPEFARLIRRYVRTVMDSLWESEGTLAFSLLTDVPAPDVGTSPDGVKHKINLMNICVDELLAWLGEHEQEYYAWLKRHLNGQSDLFQFPQELKAVPNHTGNGVNTPLLNSYFDLYRRGGIPNLVLIGAFTGKATGIGGSEGRSGATGLGVAYAVLETMKHDRRLPLDSKRFSGQTVAVQGFGNVGAGAVKAFNSLGAKVVAIAEYDPKLKKAYALYRESGFSPEILAVLEAYRIEYKTLIGFPDAVALEIKDFWELEVDILAPCAAENQITRENAGAIRAPYIVEGANGPTTPEADAILTEKKIKVIPDVFANGGGVTVSFFEMKQNESGIFWAEEEVNSRLYERIRENCGELVKISRRYKVSLRQAAYVMALNRIKKKKITRRYKPDEQMLLPFLGIDSAWEMGLFELAV